MMTVKTPLIAVAAALAVLFAAVPEAAQADPPGWHRNDGHNGWNGRKWVPRHRWENRRVIVYRYAYARRPAPAPFAFDNVTAGRLIGGILGVVVGSQVGQGNGRTAAMIGGGVIGAVVGGEVGRSMDRNDRVQTQSVLETTRTGQTVSWVNPNSGTSYNVTPTRTYRTVQGADCRDYSMWAFVGGYEEEVRGTACRKPDGTWQTVPTR